MTEAPIGDDSRGTAHVAGEVVSAHVSSAGGGVVIRVDGGDVQISGAAPHSTATVTAWVVD